MNGTLRRRLAPYDVVRVRPGVVVDGRHLESVLLTVTAVSDDQRELDATEWTGGPVMHLRVCDCCPVTPPRGEVCRRGCRM